MDYAEYFNATEWLLDVSPSLLAVIPKPVKAPAHGPGGPSTPGPGRTPTPGYAPDPGSNRDGRRQIYNNPSDSDYNRKIMEMMKQCIYNAQRKITEIEPLIHTYERDPRFRIAFIFNRLDEWLHDMRTLLKSTMKVRYYPRRVKRVIWYYEHMLRLNIDITYSVEHLIHLHAAYMKNLEVLMPLGSRLNIQKMKREQRRIKKYHQNGLDPGQDRYGR